MASKITNKTNLKITQEINTPTKSESITNKLPTHSRERF
jgi:hypothetical protein